MLWKNLTVFIFFICFNSANAKEDFSKLGIYVDTFIGTGGEGNTFPGALRPWGMVSVNPHTNYTSPIGMITGQPVAPSGYYFGEKTIKGFGQTHLSGVGCPDLGAPVVGIKTGNQKFKKSQSKYSNERAWPGYYSVILDDFKTLVEVTATKRVGVHKITFPPGIPAHIFISASKNLSWTGDEGFVEFKSDQEIVGWSSTGKFCNKNNVRKVFFAARVNKHPKEFGNYDGDEGAFWSFENEGPIELYVGVSYTSIENAQNNLDVETEGKDFDKLLFEAQDDWEKTLGRIKIKGGTPKERTLFYTSLYRSLIHPNVVSDVSGDYPLYGKEGIGSNKFYERYGVFSMWDTYRNVHALLSLIYPEKQQAMLLTLEDMAKEASYAPQWELIGNEVNMMVGDPALSIFAEGVAKGFYFKNLDELYRILYKGATEDSDEGRRPGNLIYKTLGYIPHKTSGVWGAVSTTLEYNYHDWSLAQIAGFLGKEEDKKNLLKQANGWKGLFDKDTFTLRPKDKKGRWIKAFNPKAIKGEHLLKAGGPGFVEGSAYQYAYMVPHGIKELINLHGGESEFKKHLEDVFKKGDFTLWNEPDMAYPYLFTYLENGISITQSLVKEILHKNFDNNPKGLPGNEDVGTLSAWYVFSSLGFYPADPASGEYRVGIPTFEEINITLGDKVLRIRKHPSLISEVQFDGLLLLHAAVNHAELVKGGVLDFGQ